MLLYRPNNQQGKEVVLSCDKIFNVETNKLLIAKLYKFLINFMLM